MQPWRLLLPGIPNPPRNLDERLFQSILTLEARRKKQAIRWGKESHWSIDQDKEILSLDFEEHVVRARPQVIGTFDGETFMWAWHNPSIDKALQRDARTFRGFGEKQGWQLFVEPKFQATRRDSYAIMALAAEVTGAGDAYAGSSGGTTVYCTLRDLRMTDAHGSDCQFPDDEPSVFQQLGSEIAAQIAKVQLSLSELRQVESTCRRGYEEMEAREYGAAVATLDKAWQQLGEHAADQEPASWIKLAKGNALALGGKHAEAAQVLTEANRLHDCPDQTLLYRRLGQCRLALGDRTAATDMFLCSYVGGGTEAFLEPPQVDGKLLQAQLNSVWEKAEQRVSAIAARLPGKLKRAVATVGCLITDWNSFEIEAWRLSESAAVGRKERSVLCEADMLAREQINLQWCRLMAIWFTPCRFAKCGSYQSPPEHNPKREQIKEVKHGDGGTINVMTQASEGLRGSKWRYELVEFSGRLLVSQVYSVWDDEDIPLLA